MAQLFRGITQATAFSITPPDPEPILGAHWYFTDIETGNGGRVFGVTAGQRNEYPESTLPLTINGTGNAFTFPADADLIDTAWLVFCSAALSEPTASEDYLPFSGTGTGITVVNGFAGGTIFNFTGPPVFAGVGTDSFEMASSCWTIAIDSHPATFTVQMIQASGGLAITDLWVAQLPIGLV